MLRASRWSSSSGRGSRGAVRSPRRPLAHRLAAASHEERRSTAAELDEKLSGRPLQARAACTPNQCLCKYIYDLNQIKLNQIILCDKILSVGADLQLDPLGYFLIYLDTEAGVIAADHYANSINTDGTFCSGLAIGTSLPQRTPRSHGGARLAGAACDPRTGKPIPCNGTYAPPPPLRFRCAALAACSFHPPGAAGARSRAAAGAAPPRSWRCCCWRGRSGRRRRLSAGWSTRRIWAGSSSARRAACWGEGALTCKTSGGALGWLCAQGSGDCWEATLCGR